jgi:hypothetical protein
MKDRRLKLLRGVLAELNQPPIPLPASREMLAWLANYPFNTRERLLSLRAGTVRGDRLPKLLPDTVGFGTGKSVASAYLRRTSPQAP